MISHNWIFCLEKMEGGNHFFSRIVVRPRITARLCLSVCLVFSKVLSDADDFYSVVLWSNYEAIKNVRSEFSPLPLYPVLRGEKIFLQTFVRFFANFAISVDTNLALKWPTLTLIGYKGFWNKKVSNHFGLKFKEIHLRDLVPLEIE